MPAKPLSDLWDESRGCSVTITRTHDGWAWSWKCLAHPFPPDARRPRHIFTQRENAETAAKHHMNLMKQRRETARMLEKHIPGLADWVTNLKLPEDRVE